MTALLAPSVFAFDVDHTLEVSEGPVLVTALRELVEQGHIVGLCGNWAVFVRAVPDWQRLVSFLGPLGVTKAEFLQRTRLPLHSLQPCSGAGDRAAGRALTMRAHT